MAQVSFSRIVDAITSSVKEKSFPLSRLVFNQRFSKVTDLSPETRSIKNEDYAITRFTGPERTVRAEAILPFRVRFTSVTIPGYGKGNVPPIGIAIVGVNNYIL